MESLFLDFGDRGTGPLQAESLKLHPVPMFAILDHHTRRNEQQDRVIGALMGTITGNSVEVTNAFPVHHSEDDEEVSLSRPNLTKMIALNSKVHPDEQVVGWYSTTATLPADEKTRQPTALISDFTVAVHSFFTSFIEDVRQGLDGSNNSSEPFSPVHLVVDTSLSTPTISFSAFTSTPNKILSNVLVAFNQVKVITIASDAEKIGLDAMVKGKEVRGEGVSSLPSELDALENAINNLRKMLSTTSTYVDDVVSGKKAPDQTLGRLIADALSAVPHVDPAAFHSLFSSSLQDLLMVTYLSNLTQTQLALAERIASSVAFTEPQPQQPQQQQQFGRSTGDRERFRKDDRTRRRA